MERFTRFSAPTGPRASISLASQLRTTGLAAVHPPPCDREPSKVTGCPSLRCARVRTDARGPAFKRAAGPRAPVAVESRNTVAAALWHDIGKAHDEFQKMLRNGETPRTPASFGQSLLTKTGNALVMDSVTNLLPHLPGF